MYEMLVLSIVFWLGKLSNVEGSLLIASCKLEIQVSKITSAMVMAA